MRAKKTILSVGTYHSPDGEVKVTRSRLKHFVDSFNAMKAAKLRVPVGWDHSDNPSETVPVTFSSSRNKNRSAKDGVGYLSDIRLAKDGNAAVITLDIRDSKAAEKVKDNTVQVSPIIYPSWKDGSGKEWQDVFTHVDLVHHPVDASQSDFVACSLKQLVSKKTKPKAVKLSLYRLASDSEEDMDEEFSVDDMPETEASDDTGSEESGDSKSDVMSRVVALLAQMTPPVVIPEGVSDADFLEHLETALSTANAAENEDDGEGDDMDDMDDDFGADDFTEAEPDYAMMSLSQRKQFKRIHQRAAAAHQFAQEQHRKQLADRLSLLVKDGKCSPAEMKQQLALAKSVKLSLAGGKPKGSKVQDWIESRESLPKGAVWDSGQRLSLGGAIEAAANDSEPNADEAEAIARRISRITGAK